MKTTTGVVPHDHERDYSALLESTRRSFEQTTAGASHLFLTDAADLFDLYLANLNGEAERQVHRCAACRRFIEVFGSLAVIDGKGATRSAMWQPEDVPEFYGYAFAAMAHRVERAKVQSVFLTKQPVWGTPETGPWTHVSIYPPAHLVYREGALTAGQAMAAARENYRTVLTALAEFKPQLLDDALRVFQGEHLARSEKFIGPVRWLRDLHDRPKGRAGENVLWRAIAAAPEGYCHPRASVVGSLLEDLGAGMPFADVQRRFNAKVHPLQYQRPQVAPSAGNIRVAEALVEKLGLAPALERRFARVDEVPLVWRPAPPATPQSSGVFGHLKTKDAPSRSPIELPFVNITWAKFCSAVLPNLEALDLVVPARNGSFVALTTAVDPKAPAILKWDLEGARNPFAWYCYPGGSWPAQWGLSPGAWTKVVGVSHFPNQWGPVPMAFLSEGAILLLEGCLDSHRHGGNALFPECLKSDLHAVRSTIEAYSRSAQLAGREPGAACGWDLRKGTASIRLRGLVNGAWDQYHVDRWD